MYLLKEILTLFPFILVCNFHSECVQMARCPYIIDVLVCFYQAHDMPIILPFGTTANA